MSADAVTQISERYDDFGRRWARGTSPLYEEWARGIARDTEVLALIDRLPHALQQPNRIFAAARWVGSPLAPYPEWRTWLVEHWPDVVEVATARSTQTNEPGRCATLLPVLSRIDGPVALLEVGTAGGLCLYPDRYAYEYTAPTGIRRLGHSPVTLPCTLDDDRVIPERIPEVVWRRGIDLSPIDVSDPQAVDWLATLVWPGPDHDPRVTRLREAAALVAADPPQIERGDLLERVSDVAAEAPAAATLVVFHSAVLLYLDAEQRRRFADIMGGLSSHIGRRVVWLSNESVGTLPAFDAQVPAGAPTDHRFLQTVDGRAVAFAGQHGARYEVLPFRAAAV